jgi:hypothetical protein
MKRGPQLNNLNQAMGAIKVSIKETYMEAISLHNDRGAFNIFMDRLMEDFNSLKKNLKAFEQTTFMGMERIK